jgi:cell division protein FtsA
MANDGLVVGLDIGSTKVCAIIGERDENGNIEITGVGESPSTGLRKGVVINIEATLRSVQTAIEAAEMMSGRVVTNCWTCIGGTHIEGINSRGVVAVTGKNKELREISHDDVERVLEAARAVAIPMDREVLEVIPQSFTVDEHKGIVDPLDIIGVRLEAEVHIITCAVTGAQNLIKCVNRAGFRVNGLVLQTLAAGHAVLTPEEKEAGVALVDLGGGTTDVLIYQHGAPYSTFTIPVGGAQVTNDISVVRNIALDTAEKIKVESACCWDSYINNYDDEILVSGMGGRTAVPIPAREILGIVKPRMQEIFFMIRERIESLVPLRSLGSGIVLSGGGALLQGAVELAANVFGIPARQGVPFQAGGLIEEYRSSAYATAVGLVLEGFDREANSKDDKYEANVKKGKEKPQKDSASPLSKIGQWLKKEFF